MDDDGASGLDRRESVKLNGRHPAVDSQEPLLQTDHVLEQCGYEVRALYRVGGEVRVVAGDLQADELCCSELCL